MTKKELEGMPYIVCLIDEFPKLFSDKRNKSEVDALEGAMTELLSRGRHAKIHMVLAAQNPVKKHMVCDIANLDAKIALRCSNHHQSNAILGRTGAHRLVGRGQMIFDYYADIDRRLQGAYISEADMKQQLGEIAKTFEQKNKYPLDINELDLSSAPTESSEGNPSIPGKPSAEDKFNDNLLKVIELLLDQGKIANSAVIKELSVTFRTADNYMMELENYGLIPPLNGGRGARKLNPIEKINISDLKVFLERRGYSEEGIANSIGKIQNTTISQSSPESDVLNVAESIAEQEEHVADPEADTFQVLPNATT